MAQNPVAGWNVQIHFAMACTYDSNPAMRFRNKSLGWRWFVSQLQSVLVLTPNSDANFFRVFRNFSLYCLIF
jgi:hypothetical protein